MERLSNGKNEDVLLFRRETLNGKIISWSAGRKRAMIK